MNPDEFYEILRKIFEEILSGPGVSWNKVGIMAAFDKAIVGAICSEERN